jgi:hypothetical protein
MRRVVSLFIRKSGINSMFGGQKGYYFIDGSSFLSPFNPTEEEKCLLQR